MEQSPAAEKETPSAEWSDLESAFALFMKFLNVPDEPDDTNEPDESAVNVGWHVVFRMGTVARFYDMDLDEFKGYGAEHELPEDRMSEETSSLIKAKNQLIWEDQEKTEGDVGKALRIGFKLLVDDEYPHPGGGSDRLAYQLSKTTEDGLPLWMVVWTQRSLGCAKKAMITNLALSGSQMGAVILGGDLRRYDYIQPKVFAVIGPDLAVYRVPSAEPI